jgi:hypothetical protein
VTAADLEVPFTLRGLPGQITVSLAPNESPDALGYRLLTDGAPAPFARGFPVCRASVQYPADGYAAMFGWIQLVRSSDSDPGQFELDPVALYADVATPYAWFGLRPELFDAPCRGSRADLEWLAHSFLCVSPDAVLTRRAHAVAGFSWGFRISGGTLELVRPAGLGPDAWDRHIKLLWRSFPDWAFGTGFFAG